MKYLLESNFDTTGNMSKNYLGITYMLKCNILVTIKYLHKVELVTNFLDYVYDDSKNIHPLPFQEMNNE